MGKDKRKGLKRSNSFEYYTGSGKIGEMMDRFDVKGVHYGHPDGRSGMPNRSEEDVDKDVAKAMMNDYDYRRGMEAASSYDKDAKKFAKKGFKAGNIYSAQQTMRDLKDEYGGGGGMNGAKNRASLTYDLVQQDRDRFGSQFASIADLQNLQDEMTEKANNSVTAPQGPIETQ